MIENSILMGSKALRRNLRRKKRTFLDGVWGKAVEEVVSGS